MDMLTYSKSMHDGNYSTSESKKHPSQWVET